APEATSDHAVVRIPVVLLRLLHHGRPADQQRSRRWLVARFVLGLAVEASNPAVEPILERQRDLVRDRWIARERNIPPVNPPLAGGEQEQPGTTRARVGVLVQRSAIDDVADFAWRDGQRKSLEAALIAPRGRACDDRRRLTLPAPARVKPDRPEER